MVNIGVVNNPTNEWSPITPGIDDFVPLLTVLFIVARYTFLGLMVDPKVQAKQSSGLFNPLLSQHSDGFKFRGVISISRFLGKLLNMWWSKVRNTTPTKLLLWGFDANPRNACFTYPDCWVNTPFSELRPSRENSVRVALVDCIWKLNIKMISNLFPSHVNLLMGG